MTTQPSIVLKAAEGERVAIPGESFVSKLTGADTGGALAMAIGTRAPRHGTPSHRHLKSGELWYVLEGTIVVEIDEEEFTLERGDLAFAPPGATHRITNMSDRPATVLALYTPAGPESAFSKLEELRTKSGGELNPAEVIPLMAEMDQHFVGPPRMSVDA